MTDKKSNNRDRNAAATEKSLDETPKTISKATLIMLAAAVIFIVISGILFIRFLNAPAGDSGSNSANTESRANP
jgi:uncharacterized membrane protein YvbJ